MLQLVRPHRGPITQFYGNTQPDGLPHAGQDYGYSDGVNVFPEVYAAADGVVLFAGDSRDLGWPNEFYINPDFDRSDNVDQSAGNLVVIDHGGAVTGYGHLESFGVRKGQRVSAAQQIAITGNTGYSFGKHLHFFLMFKPYNYGTPTYGCADPNPYFGGILTNLSSSIITHLQESGVALELKDLEAIQGIINPRIDQVILDNREQAKHYAAELAQVVRDNAYQVKVFTQNVVNPRLDRVDEVLNKIDEGK